MSPLLVFGSFRNSTAIVIVHEIKIIPEFRLRNIPFCRVSLTSVHLINVKEGVYIYLFCAEFCDIAQGIQDCAILNTPNTLAVVSIEFVESLKSRLAQRTLLLIMITHQIQ